MPDRMSITITRMTGPAKAMTFPMAAAKRVARSTASGGTSLRDSIASRAGAAQSTRRDGLVVADQGVELADARVGELLLDLQYLEVRGHAVLVALPLGVEILLRRIARGAGGDDVLGRGVDEAHRGAHLHGDVLPGLLLVGLRLRQIELRGLRLGARADIGDRHADGEADS